MKQSFTIAVLPGDGIGPEVTYEAMILLDIISKILPVDFKLIIIPCGGEYYLKYGREWPKGSFIKCKKADAIFLGAVGHMVNGKPVMTKIDNQCKHSRLAGHTIVIGNRQNLELYANVRPVKLYPGIQHKISNRFSEIWNTSEIDYVVVRENTEDAYTGDFKRNQDQVITPIKISRKATEKIVRYAYNLARKRAKLFKVTCVDKSNIIEAHNFFREIFIQIGNQEFPDIQQDFAYADAFCQYQLQQPALYDVVVAPNLIGDIISDNAAITQGGLGMAASANIGDSHAMFEPVHGSAPQLAGLNKANPIAAILSLSMMLDWLGDRNLNTNLKIAVAAIESAVKETIKQKILTTDLICEDQSSGCRIVRAAIQKNLAHFLLSLKIKRGD